MDFRFVIFLISVLVSMWNNWIDWECAVRWKKKEEQKMSRLSFRPRPLDIHKKLPIVKSVKDFEDDDTPTSATRNSQMLRLATVEVETEVPFSLPCFS